MQKVYVVSDFEGRFDLYINFLIKIGALDENKLSDSQRKILNSKKLPWELSQSELNDLLSIKVKDCLNPNFKGKIVINGDFVSDRVALHLNNFNKPETVKFVKNWNDACYNMFLSLRQKYKNNLILVAGNHDYYHEIFRDEMALYDAGLKDTKEKMLKLGLKRYHKIETKDGKKIIIKHAPWATEKQYNEMIKGKNINIKPKLLEWPHSNNFNDEDGFFWKYFENENSDKNYLTKSSLKEKNCFLISGHTHEIANMDGNDNTYNKTLANKYNRICTDYNVHTKTGNKINPTTKQYDSIDYFTIDEDTCAIQANDLYDNSLQYEITPFPEKKQENSEKKDNEQEKEKTNDNIPPKPKIATWMIALCVIIIGIFFVLHVKILQHRWNKKYNKKNKNINNATPNINLNNDGKTIV